MGKKGRVRDDIKNREQRFFNISGNMRGLLYFLIFNLDNKARARYLNCYWFILIGASTCGVKADFDPQFTIFNSYSLKK